MKKVLIIAEAGVNHNGDIEIAKELINVASDAGADYVKFQTFKAGNLVSKTAKKAKYQIENTGKNDTQYEMLKSLELAYENHDILIDHCKKKNIKFLSTAFDLESIDFLTGKLDFFKIPSGELTNLPYLIKVARLGLSVILSTGMANLDEVKAASQILFENGVSKDKLTILHCNTEYPTPMKDVNLNAMLTIKKQLGVKIGYSDHTEGIEIPIAAVAMGAEVIEKHFTLNRNMEGPDHKASLEPKELKEMITSIRNIEKALGHGKKIPSDSEKKNIPIARKSIHFVKNLAKGTLLKEDHLIMKRPGDGISPMELNSTLGKILVEDVFADQKMQEKHIGL